MSLIVLLIILIPIILIIKKVSHNKIIEKTEKVVTTKDVISTYDITSLYFDKRLDACLKEKYGEALISWHYAAPDYTIKYRNKENDVLIFLQHGSKKISVFSESVWGNRCRPDETPNPTDPKTENTDLDKWLIENAPLIINMINTVMETGNVEITYPIKDTKLITDIINILNKNTAYSVSKGNNENIIINFQTLLDM